MRLLPIAALQTSPVFGDPEATLERMAERVARVRGVMPAVKLVMFPELHLAALPPLLGPHNPRPTLRKGSDPFGGRKGSDPFGRTPLVAFRVR